MYSVALPADTDDSVLFSVTSNGHNDSYTEKTCRSDCMMNNFAWSRNKFNISGISLRLEWSGRGTGLQGFSTLIRLRLQTAKLNSISTKAQKKNKKKFFFFLKFMLSFEKSSTIRFVSCWIPGRGQKLDEGKIKV